MNELKRVTISVIVGFLLVMGAAVTLVKQDAFSVLVIAVAFVVSICASVFDFFYRKHKFIRK